MISPLPHIDAMAPYALATIGDGHMVSMAQNESAFPPSPYAIAAGQSQLSAATAYPDPDWTALRLAIAETHDVTPETILCGTGSMELIGCLIHAFAGPGRDVLGTEYGYAFVATATAQAQAKYLCAREVDLTVNIDRVLDQVTNTTRIVFICNPGNPTGTMIANSEILRLRDALPEDTLLVVDQAYGEFGDGDQDPRQIFALADRGNTVILRTFSKAYALAGLRAGWGVFPPAIGAQLRKLLNPNNISVVTQAMAAAAIRDQSHLQKIVADTATIRDRFAANCRELGLFVPVSKTNFILIRFASAAAAQHADSHLRTAGFQMRGMGGYGLDDCLRATICADEIMDSCFTVLKEACR